MTQCGQLKRACTAQLDRENGLVLPLFPPQNPDEAWPSEQGRHHSHRQIGRGEDGPGQRVAAREKRRAGRNRGGQ